MQNLGRVECEQGLRCEIDLRRRCTGDVATDDGLDRQDSCLADEDGAAVELVAVLLHLGGHLVDLARDDMVGDVLGLGRVREVVEEEERELREELALVGNALWTRPGGVSTGRSTERGALRRTFFMMTSNALTRSVATKRRASSTSGIA